MMPPLVAAANIFVWSKWTFIFFLRCLLLLLKCMYMLYHILGYVLSYKEIVKWDDVDGLII
jgi:hypothetical protein